MKKPLAAIAAILTGVGLLFPVVPALANSSLQVLNVDSSGQILRDSNFLSIAIAPGDKAVVIGTDFPNFVPGFAGGSGIYQEFFHDLTTGANTPLALTSDGSIPNERMRYAGTSSDGMWVAFNTDSTNMGPGFSIGRGETGFLENTVTHALSQPCLRLGFTGNCDVTSVSASGRYVGLNFNSQAYVVDMQGPVTRVSVITNNYAFDPFVSPDEHFVYFSAAVGSDPVHLFRYNLESGDTQIVDQSAIGIPGNHYGVYASDHKIAILADNRVVFSSTSSNLVPGITDGQIHIYIADPATLSIQVVDTSSTGQLANNYSEMPSVDSAGRYVQFLSGATNLDTQGITLLQSPSQHIYMKDLMTGKTKLVDQNATGLTGTSSTINSISLSGKYSVFTETSLLVNLSDSNPQNYAYLAENPLLIPADTMPPTVTATPSSQPNVSGWYSQDVTIHWTATDPAPSSGVPTQPTDTIASQEGTHTYTSAASCDPAGNCATGSVTLKIDKSLPSLSNLSFGLLSNAKSVNDPTATLTAQVGDSVSGIDRVEYLNPVTSQWQSMAVSGSTATATIATSPATFPAGMYSFQVRVWDVAGNSVFSTINLDVYDPNGGYLAGHGFVTPNSATSDPGDFMPTVPAGQNTKATLDASVKYDSASSAAPTGAVKFSYGSSCNVANNASSCFFVTFDSFDWLIISATNTTATLQGKATLTLNGSNQGSNYPVRITVLNGSPDHYSIKIYPVNANPDFSTPLYQASGDATGGQMVLHK